METNQRLNDLTHLMAQIGSGDQRAEREFFELIYHDLYQIAQARLRRMRSNFTLSPTELINETYGRLSKSKFFADPKNRAYFYGAVTRAMGRILWDYEELRRKQLDGPGRPRVSLDGFDVAAPQSHNELDFLSLRDALKQLEQLSEDQHNVIQLRFFAGLKVAETAEVLGVSVGKVESDYRKARAFLFGRLRSGQRTESASS
jgi:RNA polymerase sigma factor (TIGR02999 family)